jgi:hypothetical protein
MKRTIIWDITSYSPLKVNRRFGGTYDLHLQGQRISQARIQRVSRCLFLPSAFTMVSYPAYSSTLLMEAICASETSVDFQRTTRLISQKIALFITTAVRTSDPTRHYILEDRTLHNHRCEDLRSYTALYPRR